MHSLYNVVYNVRDTLALVECTMHNMFSLKFMVTPNRFASSVQYFQQEDMEVSLKHSQRKTHPLVRSQTSRGEVLLSLHSLSS